MKIGVVLSSGGGRGVFAHTGFLSALENFGFNISAITGCSAGALVGGIYASGADLQRWSNNLSNVTSKDYWTPDPWLLFFWKIFIRRGRGYTGISTTEAAIDFIQRNLKMKTFETCQIPFYSLATNLTQGSKTLFSSGELAPRMMASAAMPVLYRPVSIDGNLFCDGATIELSSTEAICCKHNLDALIVHHTAGDSEGPSGLQNALQKPWSLAEILNLLLYRNRPWYLSNQPLAFHRCRCGCGVPVLVVEPTLPDLNWPLSKGGPEIQLSAEKQTTALLSPYAEALNGRKHQLEQLINLDSYSYE